MVGDHTNAINEFYAATQGLSDKKFSGFAGKTLPTLGKIMTWPKNWPTSWML